MTAFKPWVSKAAQIWNRRNPPRRIPRTAGVGHEERFPPPTLSAGYAFRKETIAGMRRNGRDAPIPDLLRASRNGKFDPFLPPGATLTGLAVRSVYVVVRIVPVRLPQSDWRHARRRVFRSGHKDRPPLLRPILQETTSHGGGNHAEGRSTRSSRGGDSCRARKPGPIRSPYPDSSRPQAVDPGDCARRSRAHRLPEPRR